MPDKRFIREQELMLDGFRLGCKVFDSGFRPDFIVGLWRGGSSVGIVVQECLQYLGVQTDHISVRTSYRGISSYRQMVSHAESIRVHGLRYLFESMNAEDNLLIVDDVYSSGLNVNAILERLHYKMRKNMPQDIRIAVPWYRPDKSGPNRSGPDINKSVRIPDYYIHQTDQWLVLPYELNGLTRAEIRQHKGLGQLMDDLQEFLPDQSLQ